MSGAGGTEPGPEERPRRRLLVIANPLLSRRRKRRLDAAIARLEAMGCTVSMLQSRGPDGGALRRDDLERYDAVVAAGGDGTVNEVVNGLGEASVPLALLPLGTANVLAAELDLPQAPARLAELIVHGRPRSLYLGRVDGRRFMMMVGVGFDAHAVAGVAPLLKRLAGRLAYVAAALGQLVRYPFPLFDVFVDGAAWRASQVIVANGRYYAGRFVCAPRARLAEPGLHVCLFQSPGRWQALRYGLAFLLGRLERLSDYAVIPASSVYVAGPAGHPVQADGDIVATLPIRVGVAPTPVDVIAPEPPAR